MHFENVCIGAAHTEEMGVPNRADIRLIEICTKPLCFHIRKCLHGKPLRINGCGRAIAVNDRERIAVSVQVALRHNTGVIYIG